MGRLDSLEPPPTRRRRVMSTSWIDSDEVMDLTSPPPTLPLRTRGAVRQIASNKV